MTPRSSDVPPTKMHYEIGELGHTDFRMMARRLSHFAPGGRLVMLPRAEFEALQSRAEEAEREQKRLREIILWALGENGEFPVRSSGNGNFWWRSMLRWKLEDRVRVSTLEET